jgi:phosphohistidine phosphatase SixA
MHPTSRRVLLCTFAKLGAAASLGGIASALGPLTCTPAWGASDPLPALRAGGLAVLMRHARTTAGAGDPPGYRLGDCATQRNLDEAGRAQAEHVGRWFTKNGIAPAHVRNSPWCRCRDTARLAFGRSEDWPALGNIFDRELELAHVAEVRRFIARLKPGELAVLVSHGVTIAALTGAHPAPAEGVLVRATKRDERLEVVARLAIS